MAKNEQLSIHNFGPIKDGRIVVRDLTIFVGPQATGKSLGAQLICFLRGFEALLVEANRSGTQQMSRSVSAKQIALDTLEWWLGNPLSTYAKTGTWLSWSPGIEGLNQTADIKWGEEKVTLSRFLIKLAERKLEARSEPTILDEIYIPAGRALYSFLPPSSVLSLVSRQLGQKQWPGYMFTFYSSLGAAIDRLWHEQDESFYQRSFFEIKDLSNLQTKIDSIMKATVQYGPETIQLKANGAVLRPSTISAGQMGLWPFWAVIYDALRHQPVWHIRLYFEEPEAHLHPAAQRDLMEIIASLVNEGVKIILTTHSPYVLYAVNTFLLTHKVLMAEKSLPKGYRKALALNPKQVAAYRFAPNGKINNILDTKTGLIDENELDRVADELGADFTHLQESLMGVA